MWRKKLIVTFFPQQHQQQQQQHQQQQFVELGKKQLEQALSHIQEQIQLNMLQQTQLLQAPDKVCTLCPL